MTPEKPEFADVATLSYAQAVAELEAIIKMMQNDKCDIDMLAAYTRRATELLAACRSRLTATDTELREILDSLQQ